MTPVSEPAGQRAHMLQLCCLGRTAALLLPAAASGAAGQTAAMAALGPMAASAPPTGRWAMLLAEPEPAMGAVRGPGDVLLSSHGWLRPGVLRDPAVSLELLRVSRAADPRLMQPDTQALLLEALQVGTEGVSSSMLAPGGGGAGVFLPARPGPCALQS